MNKSYRTNNLSFLDSFSVHVDQTNETIWNLNDIQLEIYSSLLDMIDSQNDENLSVIESAKRSLIQPSVDFLETQ